ncbi:MAG: imidazole glycerol phosphate synthase subunit HisH [Proteobacteria bacterium]|nr:imidazole glycerol phosphate synthase subunit HisH [Pseudomonadota bacterium]
MAQRVVIIDYGSGNLRSAAKSFERAAREQSSTIELLVTSSARDVAAADRVVLPGVGAFAACYQGLRAQPDLVEALEEIVIRRARPFLGICVGMQLMATTSEEQGSHRGLGWIAGNVVAIEASGEEQPNELPGGRRVPHMGWNDLEIRRPDHPLLTGLKDGDNFYFVHGYALQPNDPAAILATTSYGGHITAVICRDNMAGTQFHPEKSQTLGLRMITNFLEWRP